MSVVCKCNTQTTMLLAGFTQQPNDANHKWSLGAMQCSAAMVVVVVCDALQQHQLVVCCVSALVPHCLCLCHHIGCMVLMLGCALLCVCIQLASPQADTGLAVLCLSSMKHPPNNHPCHQPWCVPPHTPSPLVLLLHCWCVSLWPWCT